MVTKDRLFECKAIPVLCFLDKAYISYESLNTFYNIPKGILKERVLNKINISQTLNIEGNHWIERCALTKSFCDEYSIPNKIELFSIANQQIMNFKKANDHLIYLFEQLKIKSDVSENIIEVVKELNYKIQFSKVSAYNISASVSSFAFLGSLKSISIRSKFLLYYSFCIQSMPDVAPSYFTCSFGSFKNKYREFIKNRTQTFLHSNLQNANAFKKFDEAELILIEKLYKYGGKWSFRAITREINTGRISVGKPLVSKNKIINTIKYNNKKYSNWYLSRNGSESISEILMHPLRQQTQEPGCVYQIDGSRFNVLYKNEHGELDFLNLVVLLDTFSKKIVSYTLTKSETFLSYHKVIVQAVKNTGFLPAEFVSDNLGALNSKECVLFISKLKTLGVNFRKHTRLTPQDKGHVESWFGIFSNQYLKGVKGYLGDGLKSRNKDGKPNNDLIREFRKQKNLQNRTDLEYILDAKIAEYNSTYIYKHSTPDQLFRERISRDAIEISKDLIPFVTFKEKQKKLDTATITIAVGKKIHEYLIYKENLDILHQYLHKEITVRFSPEDMNHIFIYSSQHDPNPIACLKLHKNLPVFIKTESEQLEWRKFTSKREALKKALINSIKTFDNEEDIVVKKEISKVPIEAILETADSKDIVGKAKRGVLFNKNSDDEILHVSFKNLFKITGSNKVIS